MKSGMRWRSNAAPGIWTAINSVMMGEVDSSLMNVENKRGILEMIVTGYFLKQKKAVPCEG